MFGMNIDKPLLEYGHSYGGNPGGNYSPEAREERAKRLEQAEKLREASREQFKTEAAQAILSVLETHDFQAWYEGEFDDYIVGENGCKTQEELLEDIKNMFKRVIEL